MENLRSKLNLETAQMDWATLEPFFARGQLLRVAPSLSLLDAAVAVAEDDAEAVARWQKQDQFGLVSDSEAATWQQADAQLWAVVVRPFVLVQERAT
ncbi:MAG: DUF2288 family protein [Pseudomonadales bacterium]